MSKKVTVIVDGEHKVRYTLAKTYGQLFDRMRIGLIPEDEVSINVNTAIARDSVVNIKIAKSISIQVDNEVINTKTTKDKVEDVLKELSITYSEKDKFSIALNALIEDGDNLVITRVESKEEVVVEEINFDEKTVNDYKTYAGETRKINEGIPGEKRLIYNVVYEDGKEVKRELIREEIVEQPVQQVIGTGIFDPYSITTVVNKNRYLNQSFEPSDLVIPNVRMSASSSRNMLRAEAATALESMFNAAESEGIYLYAVSGYRSYYYQASIYNPYSGYSAPPGASEHQLGLAMDVNTGYSGTSLMTSFAYTAEGEWVANNSHKYGFVVRYLSGKEYITGYNYEPWHLRYLGIDLATELYNSGKTLEEYYGEY